MRAGAAVHEIEVVGHELRTCERAEHELGVEAEEIEGPAPLGRVEGAERAPALGLHDVGLEFRGGVEVVAAHLGGAHGLVGESTRAAQVEGADVLAHVGVGVLHEPVAELHQVAVGVVVGPAFCVRHGDPSFRRALDVARRSIAVVSASAPAVRERADQAVGRVGETAGRGRSASR